MRRVKITGSIILSTGAIQVLEQNDGMPIFKDSPRTSRR
jgi:hypothetical protein